jgi:thiopeptide-type bacteriocin biosynthesis protein
MKLQGSQKEPEYLKSLQPSGFFAWRTPLLPFDELLAWSEGLEGSAEVGDQARLDEALRRDRLRLRARLRAIFSRPVVREALFVAAPELEEFFDLWLREPESKRGQRLELALARYFMRMAGRATPFGLFAGCSVGMMADETRLVMESHTKYQRHTRLDMDYLFALAEILGREPAFRSIFAYRPNSSLYRTAGRVRYLESRLNGKHRTYHLVAADDTDYLAATLSRAQEGASPAQLSAALAADGVAQTEAESYIEELIENQVLVPGIALPVTGPEPIHPLIEQLSKSAATNQIAASLSQTRAGLAAIDASELGAEPVRYRAIAQTLQSLPAPVELPRLFQVDLVKASPKATVGSEVVKEMVRGVELLHSLFGLTRGGDLPRFCEAFTSRYEQREVPLVVALDEEIGIGYPPGGSASEEATPLLKGLVLPVASDQTVPWSGSDTFVFRKLADALAHQAQEIVLESSDLEAMKLKAPAPLPDAFAVVATLAARDEVSLKAGNFRLFLKNVSGPSGAPLLGRFCHADPGLLAQVQAHLRAEEALQPDAVFAEIVHLPEGRLGNILHRPVLRAYEIPYLGRSGATSEQEISVTDLWVSVRDGQVQLRSARLGRKVVPRLTNAHAFYQSSSGIYRFLSTLQFQGIAAGFNWDWGVLMSAPFLPRVVTGRLVLSLARWRVSKEEIKRLGAVSGAAAFQAVRHWRVERGLPRWVALADGDNALPIDLDNVLSIEALIHLIKPREEAALTELFPGPDQLCARGPEGRFVHELIVPFVREKAKDETATAKDKTKQANLVEHLREAKSGFSSPLGFAPSDRHFPPGSAWLYAKLYAGTSVVDQVLRDTVKPLTEELLESGAADSWFFIRYGDPDWHLRLRFRGNPKQLQTEALPQLQAAVAPLMQEGKVWRLQLDTYEREVERYGGEQGIELAEQLFHADSEAVLEIMEMLEPGDSGLDERWRLTLRGMDMILNDFGFDLDAKHTLLVDLRKAFAKEFQINEYFIGELGNRFRKDRKSLEALLDATNDAVSDLWPGIEVLQRRSQRWTSTIAELKDCAQQGRLLLPLENLASSHLHMHANRLLRSAQRGQELVIYDYLARLYESHLARSPTRHTSMRH